MDCTRMYEAFYKRAVLPCSKPLPSIKWNEYDDHRELVPMPFLSFLLMNLPISVYKNLVVKL